MISIKFYQRPDQGSIHMEMRGHAGSAPEGMDLVCGAASMLAYTLGQTVRFLSMDGKLGKKPKLKIRKGNAQIVATPTKDGYAQVLNAFWVVQCGAMVLARNHPEFVKLECIGE